MSKHEVVRCDIDGTDHARTVRFGYMDVGYEIDLSADRESDLRDMLAPYIEAGRHVVRQRRRVKGVHADPPPPRVGMVPFAPPVVPVQFQAPSPPGSNRDIRAWATAHGFDVAPKGRIRADVIEAYRAAQHARG